MATDRQPAAYVPRGEVGKGVVPGKPYPAPGMTDLMISPEAIDAYLAENPPPVEVERDAS